MNIKGNLYLVMLAVLAFALCSREIYAQLPSVTPHDLLPEQKIVVDTEDIPQWKMLWDEARKSAMQGDFETSLRQYRALLAMKSGLEEARWEMARLLMYLKDWDEAAGLLELLIESEPDSTVYINALGKVMWEKEHYERAVDLFKRVYEKKPSDQTALAGLVEGLTKLDRKIEALPYLEQLLLQEPTNRGIRRYLALLLYEMGNYEKARAHFTILSRNDDVEFDVLYKTAKTYERLGYEQQASQYWERVLVRESENIEAHLFLARYYEKAGQFDRALLHFQAIITQRADDIASYAKLGETYEKAKEYDKALTYYEKYLTHYPDDKKVRQRVTATRALMEKEKQPEASRRNYAGSTAQELTESIKATIRNLETAGRYSEAVPLYRQLLEMSPKDEMPLAFLANGLIVIHEKEGPDAMVKFLNDIAQDNKSIYRFMAERMQQMEKGEELLAILQEMHKRDSGDIFTTQELAILYLERGQLPQSREYFAELADTGCRNVRCLEARASLAEKLDLPMHQLKDYEALLLLQPSRYEIRLEVISLAAGMGFLDKAVFHAGYLQNLPPVTESNELRIYLADTYRQAGYLTRAVERYSNFIEQAAGLDETAVTQFRIHSWLGIAESYKMLGMEYEAEQALRKALVREEDRIPILEALFYLFLETRRIAESETWLQAINGEIDAMQQDDLSRRNLEWKKGFLEAEMYAVAGDHDLAIDLYRQAETSLQQYESNSVSWHDKQRAASGFRIRTNMAASLLQDKEYEAAEQIVLELRTSHAENLELLVLLEQIYRAWGNNGAAENIAEELRVKADQDFGRRLSLARFYRKFKNLLLQSGTAEKAVNQEPDSLAAKLLLVNARMQQGELVAALELLDQYLRIYPENTWFLSQQAELLAKVGKFTEALSVVEMLLAENPERRDIVLLQARILWEMNRWKDSVVLYDSLSEPPVEKTLQDKIGELTLAVDQSPSRTSWWEVITFSEGNPLSISQVIMSPQHAVDFSENGQAANSLAADYYALYRWQDRFNKELLVRRSVMRREFYHAANRLENVIEEYGRNDFLLYDLAGLYSKLERLGDEAIIYRELEAQNAEFPGLAEAFQRNNLKRRPRISLAYIILDDDGWDGYKSVRQEVLKADGRYFQATNQEWNLDIARINYESTRDNQNIRSWRAMLNYNARLTQALELTLGGGFEKLQSPYDTTPLWYGAVTGKIADEMRAVFSVRQDIVADTTASLTRNIRRRDYKAEFIFDLFPRLLLGGYYDFIDYSDDNWTNNYSVWASYIVLPEPTLIKLSYNYDFYDSRDGQMPGPPADDGFAPDDHPYWSPLNYWITRFSFYFKHLLSNDTLARGVPSYYTFEYSLGYDSDDNDLHELKAGIYIEIAKNYIVSASYGYLDMDVYQHKEALLSLMYRF